MKYLQKQLIQNKGKAVWLVSYPKSGNTWFRCFLSALFHGEVDLANLKTNGIFSSRNTYERIHGINSRFLENEEFLNNIPEIHRYDIQTSPKMMFIKVHDAFQKNSKNESVFPIDVSHKVIYLVRNPLDIVASFANHLNTSKDNAIKIMNNPKGFIGGGKLEGLHVNNQFRQLMYSWSGHYESWNKQKYIDVVTVRYEDLLNSTFTTFKTTMEAIGIQASDTAIKKAIRLSSFKKLKKAENETGFNEKSVKSKSFFRTGKSEGYKNELSEIQISSIIKTHKKSMKKLNYL